MIMEGIAAA